MSRVLVTGASGMLGSQLLLDAPRGVTAVGTDLRAGDDIVAPGYDLADPARVEALLAAHGPFEGVIHAAAWTAVDLAEEREAEAARANVDATRELARAVAQRGIPLVLVSTDFVFDGCARRPYRVDDETRPLSAYGRTKLAGELAAREAHPAGTRIVRTQWLYGPRGKHFPGTILALAKERKELRVVHDQVGAPTSTLELAPALWDVLRAGEAGVYHAACDGQASWFELAVATLELAGVTDVRVEPCTTSEFPRPAARPRYSVLDCSRLTALRGRPLAPWRAALAAFLALHRP
ncbi:MAG: dTDP-4-dehydrorhamnose reductase [Planctomycetes bacterium]|nr:dTDP-4-dehydrorhamnose reductase [Planctomycetota bacterium]